MPTPRKSYAQAELEGSIRVNKARFADRANAPETTGSVGDPPKYFKAAQKAVWHRLVQAIPAGVVGSADCFAVEIAARLLHEFRTDFGMQASKISILVNVMSRLGLDPQARTKLMLGEPKKKESKFVSLALALGAKPN